MLPITDVSFWAAAIPSILMLSFPIAITAGTGPLRTILTSATIYFIITAIAACNLQPPF